MPKKLAKSPGFDEMYAKCLQQQPSPPDPSGWEGFTPADGFDEQTRDWMQHLSTVPLIADPEDSEPAAPTPPPFIDDYADDTERTHAWLNGADMTNARKWIHSTLPCAYYAADVLASEFDAEVLDTEVRYFEGKGWRVILRFARKVVNGYDVLTAHEWTDTEAKVPGVQAMLFRNLLVESVGLHGMRKAKERL